MNIDFSNLDFPTTAFVIVAFAIALLVTLAFVPVIRRLAVRWRLVDLPDEKRKLHQQPIPLIGGIAIFLGVLFSLSVAGLLWGSGLVTTAEAAPEVVNAVDDEAVAETEKTGSTEAEGIESQSTPNTTMQLAGLLLASLFILIVGVCDDRFGIRGRQKLVGQILAATILVLFGFRFPEEIRILNFEDPVQLGVFSWIATYAWILVGINSVNLLDGADGFATTIGLLASASLCVIALSLGRALDAVILAAMVGALLAFMRYNFPPASAYLGDAGSMLVGLFLSAMAIRCTFKEAALFAFFAPVALLAIPMFDTFAAIVRRQLTGRSIYTVDRGHLHHALIRKGFSPRKALLLFFAMCLMTATGSALSVLGDEPQYAIASILAVVIFLVVGRVFGFGEFRLLANKTKSILGSFLVFPARRNQPHQVAVRLQGERDWSLFWEILTEFATKYRLAVLTMDLNLPWLHESFHAKFQQGKRHIDPDLQWTAEIPLRVEKRIIGRLDLTGNVDDGSMYETLGELDELLTSLQPYFARIMQSPRDALAVEMPSTPTAKEFPLPRGPVKDPRFVDAR